MSFFHDFKKFIGRGNVMDMAVGIILGASFTKIVDVLVNHILMPPLAVIIGGIDFSSFTITLKKATATSPSIHMDCGLLINMFINFFIVGFSVFIIIKILNRLHLKSSIFSKQICPECKMEIPVDARRCGHCTSPISKGNASETAIDDAFLD